MDPAYAKKRKEWIEALGAVDGHRNCIFRQLCELIHDASTFWWINESRRLAPRDSNGHPMLNGAMHRLLDKCFFTSQKIGLRRLLDRPAKSPKRGVFSVRTLLADMKKHRALLTRANIFGGLSVVMDIDAPQGAPDAHRVVPASHPDSMRCMSNELSTMTSREAHRVFDLLSGKSPASRSPTDTVRESVLESISSRLDAIDQRVVTYVDKYIAHAATPVSIADKAADQIQITIDELWDTLETLWTACQFVDCHILRSVQTTAGFIYAFDMFQHLDKPSVRATERAELERIWREHQKTLDRWGTNCLTWAVSEVACT